MTTTDIEKIATNKIEEEILKNSDCLSPYINSNDKTPLWDGNIFVYSGGNKTNDLYEGKIDVQIKGRNVKQFKKTNTFQIEVETLKGYQKEVKGTLLFVVDFKTIDDYKIFYCNLLPVDIYQILKKLDDNQKFTSLKLKEINDKGVLSFKNVCINFYKNSNKQAGKRIIDETEFGKIENFQTEVVVNANEYEEYIETADVYSYAQLKDTHEEVVTIKGEWTSYSTIKKDIVIENKKYYSDFTAMGTKKDKFIIGPITINFIDNKVHIDLKGTLQKRVKDLKFILSLFKYQYIMIDDVKLEFPFVNQEKINRNIDLFNKQLNYFEKIVKVFKFFNTEFDMNYEDLSEIDLKNLHRLMNLFDGCFGDEIKELQKYYIQINKYKFIFLIVKSSKRLYNFYSKEIIDNMICFFKFENKEVKTSIYANLVPEEFIGMNNFNSKLIIKSFKNIELTKEVCDSINQLILMFINVYDDTKNSEYINIADSLSQINCKNRNNDIDIINAKQIKYRKKGCLSTNDKKLLSDISKKEENRENYQILCCISLLVNNYYSFEENFSKMFKKEQGDFKKYPIYNLASKK